MIIESLEGNWVRLRCVEERDAEFTLAIRNDPELTKYISRINNTVSGQREWIRNYRLSDDGCLFVIENNFGESIGTISFFNIDNENNTCEAGRFVSYGNPIENLETSILLADYLFQKYKISKQIIYIYKENKSIINYNKRLGYEFVKETVIKNTYGDDEIGLQFELTPDKYYAKRSKLVALLDAAKQRGL